MTEITQKESDPAVLYIPVAPRNIEPVTVREIAEPVTTRETPPTREFSMAALWFAAATA